MLLRSGRVLRRVSFFCLSCGYFHRVLSLSFTPLRSDWFVFPVVVLRVVVTILPRCLTVIYTHLLRHLGHSFTLTLKPRLVIFILVSLHWLQCGLDDVLLLHFRFPYLDSFFVPSPVTQSVCFTYTHTHSVPCAF